MWWLTERRSEAPELMDDLSLGGAELEGALRQLRVINRSLGAAWPTLEGVVRLWRQAGRPRRLALTDVGAGSGELCRPLLNWARRRGIEMEVTLIDIHPETCAAAERLFAGDRRVRVRCADLRRLEPAGTDIVTASLVLHHFPTSELPSVLSALRRSCRLGVVINDLHRHPVAWSFIRAATALLSRNRMIRHDAPLSVLRGFREHELERLARTPGLEGLTWHWRPLFRYLILLSACGGEPHA